MGVLAASTLGFFGFAPNRILSGKPVFLGAVLDPAELGALVAGGLLTLGGIAAGFRRVAAPLVLAGSVLVLFATFAAAGTGATALTRTAASPAARVFLGGGFWLMVVTAVLAASEALRRWVPGNVPRILFGIAVLVVLGAMAKMGWFDDLSIVREWSNRRDEYATAVGDHIRLVLASLAVALVIGAPLGVVSALRRREAGRIFAVLSIIQTIPSVALFGLLIGPLSALSTAVPFLGAIGVRGIGFTPALIALVLYGLLPIARNTEVGLLGVPERVVDAARGMGMTERQIFLQVSVPLALPVLLAGLRIVAVQTIGLTVVAALIGAGGLGSFVFLGLGQTATDLVLLGALSTILLALIADAALRVLAAAVTPAGMR